MTKAAHPVTGLHLVRYGTAADQKYLLGDFLKTYDQLIINANMVAHMRSALSSFISQRAKKSYFIDPQTHAFQHDTTHLASSSKYSVGEIKRSIKALLKAYGEPVETRVGQKQESIIPQDFKNPTVRLGFCRRVLKFQCDAIIKEVTESDSAKYFQYLKKKGMNVGTDHRPALLVAPYFYMEANTVSHWLPVNLDLVRDSLGIAEDLGIPLATQIVFSQDLLLNQSLVQRLIASYTEPELMPSVYLIWVDSFSEQEASENLLRSLITLLKGLGASAPVVNLYGGFFSVALNRCKVVPKLIGVSHSLEYGEHRAVVPIGGGVPVAKFYLPALHARLPFRVALRAVRALGGFNGAQEFRAQVCDCAECKQVIRDPETDFAEYGRTKAVQFSRKSQAVVMEYPLPETKDHSVKHYMWCKAKEYNAPISLNVLLRELEQAEKRLSRVVGFENSVHCQNWRNVLAGLTSE